jgi:hypothetical protein
MVVDQELLELVVVQELGALVVDLGCLEYLVVVEVVVGMVVVLVFQGSVVLVVVEEAVQEFLGPLVVALVHLVAKELMEFEMMEVVGEEMVVMEGWVVAVEVVLVFQVVKVSHMDLVHPAAEVFLLQNNLVEVSELEEQEDLDNLFLLAFPDIPAFLVLHMDSLHMMILQMAELKFDVAFLEVEVPWYFRMKLQVVDLVEDNYY